MKRVALGVVLAGCCLFLLGMGGLGGPAKVHVPELSKNYSATILDQSGISSDVEMLSFGGHTAISGQVGNALVSIDFDEIDAIAFVQREDNLVATVTLKDAKTLSMTVDDKALTCYARLPYGGYRIEVTDIRLIDIKGVLTTD